MYPDKVNEPLPQTLISLYLLNPMSLTLNISNYVRSNILSLKYQRFTSSGYKDIGIRKFELLAKTQILYSSYNCTEEQNKRSCEVTKYYQSCRKQFALTISLYCLGCFKMVGDVYMSTLPG